MNWLVSNWVVILATPFVSLALIILVALVSSIIEMWGTEILMWGTVLWLLLLFVFTSWEVSHAIFG